MESSSISADCDQRPRPQNASCIDLQYANDTAICVYTEEDLSDHHQCIFWRLPKVKPIIEYQEYRNSSPTSTKWTSARPDNSSKWSDSLKCWTLSVPFINKANIDDEIQHWHKCSCTVLRCFRNGVFNDWDIHVQTKLLAYQTTVIPTLLMDQRPGAHMGGTSRH